MCFSFGLDPILPQLNKSIDIFSEGFRMSISEVTRDVVEEVLWKGGKRLGSFGRDR